MWNGCFYQEPALFLVARDTQKMERLPWETPATLLSGRLCPPALVLRLGSMAVCLCARAGGGRWHMALPPSSVAMRAGGELEAGLQERDLRTHRCDQPGQTGRLAPPPLLLAHGVTWACPPQAVSPSLGGTQPHVGRLS